MTTPQEAARSTLARVLPTIDLRYSDGSGFGPGLDGAMFEDHEADHWADAILAAIQADPDAARAVVALLGGEGPRGFHRAVFATFGRCEGEQASGHADCQQLARELDFSQPAPQDDREAAVRALFSGEADDMTAGEFRTRYPDPRPAQAPESPEHVKMLDSLVPYCGVHHRPWPCAPESPEPLDVDTDDFRDAHERATRDHILGMGEDHRCDDLCSDAIVTYLAARLRGDTP